MSILNKLFKNKNSKMSDTVISSIPTSTTSVSAAIASNKPVITPELPVTVTKPKFKFDIEVIDTKYDGSPMIERFDGVEAESADAIRSIYAMCGQKVKILHQIPIQNTDIETIPANNQNIQTSSAKQEINSVSVQQAETKIETTIKPIFKTIGGIKLKIVGDEVYQKQWLRCSSSEASSIRIVNDKTNKVIDLTGKHIEIEKWIKVDDEQEMIEETKPVKTKIKRRKPPIKEIAP